MIIGGGSTCNVNDGSSVCDDNEVENAHVGNVCDGSDVVNDMVVGGSLCDMGVQIMFVSDSQPTIIQLVKERKKDV